MFKTLFSRMLATYLSVTLGLLILLGFTVGTVFQNQYKTEKRDELKREAQEISAAVTERYIDSAKRAVAEKELLTIAEKYDARSYFSLRTRALDDACSSTRNLLQNGRAATIWIYQASPAAYFTAAKRPR